MGMEPMTCAPNGFASGDGLLTLEPGQMFSARWGICID
jgi:aldose 1-epimerase